MDSESWRIRMSDWAHLQSRLIWAYEGNVQPQYRNVRDHIPGQSAILLRQGSLVVETEKGRCEAAAGQWIFPRNGQRHQIFSDDAKILSIRFELQWPGGHPLFDSDVAVVFRSAQAPRLEAEANQLRQLVELRFPNVLYGLPMMEADLKTHLALQRFFSTWLCTYADVFLNFGLTPTRLGKIDARVLQIVKILDHFPLNSDFTEKELAHEVGLSPSQLDRLFSKQFGVTPWQYLDRRRLIASAELIQSSHLSIQQIAYEMGFNSLPYFSRWFRSKTGLPPRHFKRSGALSLVPLKKKA